MRQLCCVLRGASSGAWAVAPDSCVAGLLESDSPLRTEAAMKKLKHEAELVKGAILAGMKYGVERGAVVFEPTDSAYEKIRFIYRLLVHDKLITPMPEDQVTEQSMKHRLAIWYSKQLPKDHPLLK